MMSKLLLAIFCLLLPFSTFAEEFVLGKDYEIVTSLPNEQEKSDKIILTEFFNYGCPWCYRIEPNLRQWLKQHQNEITFKRVAVVFNKEWGYYAKAYYAAHLLGIEEKVNPLLFKIIQGKNNTLTNNANMIAFFEKQHVDKATAESAFLYSTMINMQIDQGMVEMSNYHITGVPAVVINNQFKTDLQMAQSERRFFKIMDFLIAKSKNKS